MTNAPDLHPSDVLAIGPHPDDVEIAAAGTLLRLVAGGATVALLDLTRGEKGTRGDADQRAREAAAAAARLGAAQRHCLCLPDCGLVADAATVDLLVAALRAVRPRLLLGPHAHDVHPDHCAAAAAIEHAFFLAGLPRHRPDLGAPCRPSRFLRYPGNRPIAPTVVVDIADQVAAKAAVLRCYQSQLAPPERGHLILGLDVLERAEVRDRYFGAVIGTAAGEAFQTDGPLPLSTASALLGG